MREIFFDINGQRYEATVEEIPVRRSVLTDGHMTVDHSSESYAIYLTLSEERPYIARPIVEVAAMRER